MAAILGTLGFLGLPLVRGFPKLSGAERAAWAWAAGLVMLCAAEAALVLAGIRSDPWKLWGLMVAAALALRSRRTEAPRDAGPPNRIGRLAWALAIGALALFAVEAVSEPMWAWDFVAIWGLKGKTLFLAGGLPVRLFHDPRLAFVHPGYPLLLPVLFASLSTLLGIWDPQALALLYPGFELATLLAIWGFLRRRSGSTGAAVGTVLTAGFFPLYQSYFVGLADIPLALGYVLAGTAALDALDSGGAPSVRSLLLAALWCCSLKKEGTVFLLLLAGAVLLRRNGGRHRSWTAAAVYAVVPLVHQAVLRWLRGPVADPAFRWSQLIERGGGQFERRLLETGGYLLHAFVPWGLPALLAIAAILAGTRSGIADALFEPMAMLTILYALAPALSTWADPALFAASTFARLTFALAPALFLTLGARISATPWGRFPQGAEPGS
jgi:hypothetical protein